MNFEKSEDCAYIGLFEGQATRYLCGIESRRSLYLSTLLIRLTYMFDVSQAAFYLDYSGLSALEE